MIGVKKIEIKLSNSEWQKILPPIFFQVGSESWVIRVVVASGRGWMKNDDSGLNGNGYPDPEHRKRSAAGFEQVRVPETNFRFFGAQMVRIDSKGEKVNDPAGTRATIQRRRGSR